MNACAVHSLFFFGVGVFGTVCEGILAGSGILLPSFAGCFEGGVSFFSGSFAIIFQEIDGLARLGN